MTRQKLIEKHGTLEQFEKAVWDSCNDLFTTEQEAIIAINKYKFEWQQAEKRRS